MTTDNRKSGTHDRIAANLECNPGPGQIAVLAGGHVVALIAIAPKFTVEYQMSIQKIAVSMVEWLQMAAE